MVSPSLEPTIEMAEVEHEVNISDHAPVSAIYQI
jgi:exonuclease III